MSVVAQRVVVIQDASRDVSSSAIKWAIDGLFLKPGDELTLLGVLHQVNTPSTFPFTGAGKRMGYKSRVDSNSMLAANQNIINEEISRKEEEFRKNKDILEISMLYETRKIAFHKRVVAASSPKVAALEAAKKLRATWIILDRQMKKDKKYFMERLSCGISRMKRNNSVELLRGPVHARRKDEYADRSHSNSITYNEMHPETERMPHTPKIMQETLEDDDLFSLEFCLAKPKSPHKTSSDDEIRIDTGEGNQGTSLTASSLSSSTSYENLDQKNSISNKPKYSSYQLQEEGGYVHTKRESPINNTTVETSDYCEVQSSRSNQGMNQKKEQNQSKVIEEITRFRLISKVEEREDNPMSSDLGNEVPKFELKTDFTYAELHIATNGFSEENFLSEGGFGSVYKGRLKNGQFIAVKQHKPASFQGEKEFRSEVSVLSKARHKNVVMLLGSCSEGSHRLLVYEYVSNGSLDTHLSKDNPNVLSWENRLNIALGAARGLNYLHQNNIIHRDMRPNNILLTHNFEPLLGDFGLARAQHDESDPLSENKVVGTIGYLAPDYAENGRASTKTDVYSFGVVLLELITGRTTTDLLLQEKSLLEWARPHLKERKYPELIDERILDFHDVYQLFSMISVAERCLREDPDKRPSMEKVECALKRTVDGETVSGMEEFSPTNSSFSSLTKSNESQCDQKADEHDRTSSDASPIRTRLYESQSATSLAQLCSTTSSSVGTPTNSEGSLTGKRRSPKQKRGRPRSQQVLYNEMLDD